MSQHPHSPVSVRYPQAQAPTNGLGVAGFVLSIAGYLTCGLLCPIGMILSAVGMRRQPKGLAIAGFVIGLIGTIVPLILFFIYGAVLFSACSCLTIGSAAARPMVDTARSMTNAEMRINPDHV